MSEGLYEKHNTLEEAKAACQADFARRVGECVEVDRWQDISTAPLDADFLAVIRSDRGQTTMCVGRFREDGFYVAGDDLSNAWTPTHWQPLPPPPGEDVKS